MVRAVCDRTGIERLTLQFVRHDEQNRTVPRPLVEERVAFDLIAQESAALGAELVADGVEMAVKLRA
jgi:hypothetical protein